MTLAWLALALVFLAAAGFYSGSEMGLYSLNRLRLRLRADRGSDPRARLLLNLVGRMEESVLGVLLTQNFMNYLLTVATVAMIAQGTRLTVEQSEVYAAVVLSPITFVFGDVVPKNWFQAQANRLMYPVARAVYLPVLVFRYTGLLWILSGLTRLLAAVTGEQEPPHWHGARGEVVGLLREGAAEGTLTEEQTHMIERVMSLSETRVGHIMIPRKHVVALSPRADRRELERLARTHDFSRLPVLSFDGRDVTAIINIHDVLGDESGGPIDAHKQAPVRIEASASATQALVRLREARASMAVILDRRHGFVGIVTLKDVVEEIFGELGAW